MPSVMTFLEEWLALAYDLSKLRVKVQKFLRKSETLRSRSMCKWVEGITETALKSKLRIGKEINAMKTKTRIKAGGVSLNHNETLVRR
jgi:hypothetical protein